MRKETGIELECPLGHVWIAAAFTTTPGVIEFDDMRGMWCPVCGQFNLEDATDCPEDPRDPSTLIGLYELTFVGLYPIWDGRTALARGPLGS